MTSRTVPEELPSIVATCRLGSGGLTTVQDLGRPGWQRVGVTPGGAMDRVAARAANLLLGNSEDAPVIESALTGPELRFHADMWIAVTGAARSPAAPELPTMIESGFPGFEAGSWYGLFAPAGTPREILSRLNADMVKALRDRKSVV